MLKGSSQCVNIPLAAPSRTFKPLCSRTIILACSWACPNGTRISSSKVMTLRAAQASLTTSGCPVWCFIASLSNANMPAFTRSWRFCSCFKQKWRTVRTPRHVTVGSFPCTRRTFVRKFRPSSSSRSGCPSFRDDRAERADDRAATSLSSDFWQQERIVG